MTWFFADRVGLLDGFPFHFEINGCIPVCRIDAGVAEPVADRGYIDAGLKKVYRCAVTHAMGMETFHRQGWRVISCSHAVLGEDVSDTKACERFFSVIAEQRFSRGSVGSLLAKKSFEDLSRLIPKGTDTFLASFPKEPCVVWLFELKITRSKIEDFLNASAGIEHGDEQCVVSTSIHCPAIDHREYGLDLVKLEILHSPGACAFKRNSQYPLAQLQFLGIAAGEEAEKTMDSRQSNVAGRGDVVAIVLKVLKEVHHLLWADVIEFEGRGIFSAPFGYEAEKQF